MPPIRHCASLFSAVAAVVLSCASCSKRPPPPPCERVAGVSDDAVGNAGCLIAVEDKVIFVQDRASGGLGAPGGTAEAGEKAACTACRETWEETGLRVRVGRLLVRHDNGFHLYMCEPIDLVDPATLSVPEWGKDEIAAVQLVNPETLEPSRWRFPEYRDEVIGVVKELGTGQQ